MTADHHSEQNFTTGDYNLSLPLAVLHFGPLLLGLYMLFLSLCGPSVFRNFEERCAGTAVSVALMCACLLLTLPAVACGSLDRTRRATALLLTGVIALALLDETRQVHEALGRSVKRAITWLPRSVLHYTDDVLVILGTLLAGLALYVCLRRAKAGPGVYSYLWLVVALGMGHGVLDLLGHGRYLWQYFWPSLTTQQLFSPLECEGFYEESLKLWTEWFAVLFLLRFFHGQRGPLIWTSSVFLGTMLAPLGLWQVGDAPVGVPVFVVGGALRFIRNYHLLALLTWIWVGWGILSWRLVGRDPAKQAVAGLFYVCPFYLLLPGLSDPLRFYRLLEGAMDLVRPALPFVTDHVVTLVAAPTLLLPGVLAGLAAAAALSGQRRTVLSAILLFALVCLFSRPLLVGNVLQPLGAGGLVLPAVGFAVVTRNRRSAALVLPLLGSLLVIGAPLWHITVLTLAFALWLTGSDTPLSGWSRRFRAVLFSLHLVTVAVLVVTSPPTIMTSGKRSSGPYYSDPLSIHYEPMRWGQKP